MAAINRWTLRACLALLPLAALAVCEGWPSNANCDDTKPASEGKNMTYPVARQSDQVDDYHGISVADPFRWLEDTDSAETRAWIAAENEVTADYLAGVDAREPIRRRLTQLWNYERYGVPQVHAGRYFYTRNDGLQNQSVLYWSPGLNEEPRLLLDPNQLAADGTVALSGISVSDDGRWLAYGLASAGSDWQTWRVREVSTGLDRPDELRWIKFSGASWTADSRGFFYSRYDEPTAEAEFTGSNYYQKLYYHRLGTEQVEDRLVYQRQDEKEWGFGGQVTDDGKYLVIGVWRGTERKNQIFYLDLTRPDAEVVELIVGFEARYEFVGNDGPKFWLRTDLQAPRNRLIEIDLRAPAPSEWRQVIAEPAGGVLEGVTFVGGRFLAAYLEDAHSRVKLFQVTGEPAGELELPGLGTASGFGGRADDRETFYAFTSFTEPTSIYRYDVAEGKSHPFRRPKVDFRPEDYETRQVFYASADGTRIPMFITHRKGLELNGQNPTMLYGYGGFDISMTPSFSVGRIVWLEMGGVFAMPNLRGGGEYGRGWHEQGMKAQKQNVFEDFIAAAEYLIAQRYTSTPRLAINGRSNGGLLVGACLTQRPDLFGAALPAVGVMDMLRFHKFTIGWAWTSEYGSSDDAEEFRSLFAYSPLHNIRPGVAYPATLVTTADHDDRVVPGHSFKFAAALQAAHSGQAPVLIRIETSAGHGAGTPTAKAIEELADSFAFLVKSLGVRDLPAGWR